MSVLTDLVAARDALSAEFAAHCARVSAVSTDQYGPDEAPGVAWTAYRDSTLAQLAEMNKQIIQLQAAVEMQSVALG